MSEQHQSPNTHTANSRNNSAEMLAPSRDEIACRNDTASKRSRANPHTAPNLSDRRTESKDLVHHSCARQVRLD